MNEQVSFVVSLNVTKFLWQDYLFITKLITQFFFYFKCHNHTCIVHSNTLPLTLCISSSMKCKRFKNNNFIVKFEVWCTGRNPSYGGFHHFQVIGTEFWIGENAPQLIKDLSMAATVTGITLEYHPTAIRTSKRRRRLRTRNDGPVPSVAVGHGSDFGSVHICN